MYVHTQNTKIEKQVSLSLSLSLSQELLLRGGDSPLVFATLLFAQESCC